MSRFEDWVFTDFDAEKVERIQLFRKLGSLLDDREFLKQCIKEVIEEKIGKQLDSQIKKKK